MVRQLLNPGENSLFIAILTFKFSNPYQLRVLCFFVFFVLTGCASLHLDMVSAVDWNQVRVLQFQSPEGDPWELTQPIKAELQAMGFQVDNFHAKPDLLFSYFIQEGFDLTAESEVLLRLKSLHVQFIDPATKNLVTAVDYFYPEVANPPAPVTGVKEIFAGLRQQIHAEIEVPATPLAQPYESQPDPSTSALLPVNNEPEKNPADHLQSTYNETVSPQPVPTETVLKKADSKSTQQATQKSRSPWLPKLKSWGFDNWGKDEPDDY